MQQKIDSWIVKNVNKRWGINENIVKKQKKVINFFETCEVKFFGKVGD